MIISGTDESRDEPVAERGSGTFYRDARTHRRRASSYPSDIASYSACWAGTMYSLKYQLVTSSNVR